MICSQCKKEFIPSSRKQKHCSKTCSNKNYKQSFKGRKSIKKYNQSDKRKVADKKYRQSDKGKEASKGNQQSETYKRYRQSDKFKETLKKYQQSNKGKTNKKKWRQSDKGKEASKRNQQSESYKRYHQSDKFKETVKKYQQSNKGKKLVKKRHQKKMKTDPIYKLIVNSRSRLSQTLRIKGIKKLKTTIALFGCSPEFLKNYLEKQFHPHPKTNEKMTWQNHTLHGWHVDHRDPLDLAMNSKDIEELCHYTNLQPMWASENRKKSNKII
jgi:hypothetical protein